MSKEGGGPRTVIQNKIKLTWVHMEEKTDREATPPKEYLWNIGSKNIKRLKDMRPKETVSFG